MCFHAYGFNNQNGEVRENACGGSLWKKNLDRVWSFTGCFAADDIAGITVDCAWSVSNEFCVTMAVD